MFEGRRASKPPEDRRQRLNRRRIGGRRLRVAGDEPEAGHLGKTLARSGQRADQRQRPPDDETFGPNEQFRRHVRYLTPVQAPEIEHPAVVVVRCQRSVDHSVDDPLSVISLQRPVRVDHLAFLGEAFEPFDNSMASPCSSANTSHRDGETLSGDAGARGGRGTQLIRYSQLSIASACAGRRSSGARRFSARPPSVATSRPSSSRTRRSMVIVSGLSPEAGRRTAWTHTSLRPRARNRTRSRLIGKKVRFSSRATLRNRRTPSPAPGRCAGRHRGRPGAAHTVQSQGTQGSARDLVLRLLRAIGLGCRETTARNSARDGRSPDNSDPRGSPGSGGR